MLGLPRIFASGGGGGAAALQNGSYGTVTWSPGNANYTATANDYRNTYMFVSGTNTTLDLQFILPATVGYGWWIWNGSGRRFVAKTAAGTGVSCPVSTWTHCTPDGTNILRVSTSATTNGAPSIAANNVTGFEQSDVAGTALRPLIKLDSNNDVVFGDAAVAGRAYFRATTSVNLGTSADFSCMQVTSGTIQVSNFTAYTMAPQGQIFDSTTRSFTIRGMAPFSSATGANRTPGSVIIDTPSPSNAGTTRASIALQCEGNNVLSITRDTSGNNRVRFDVPTGTTVGAAGGGDPLPATPTGYLTVNIAGTDQKIPYYAT